MAKPNTVLYVCGTVIVISLIGAGTFLTQTGHSHEVQSTVVILANAVISLVNLLGISVHNKAVTQEQTTELESVIPQAVHNGNTGPDQGAHV